MTVANANFWSLQTPYLYNLVSTVSNQNAVADVYYTTFGVRTVSIDSTNGVFHQRPAGGISGMCNHQDIAGVGIAVPDRLLYYRLERMKQMGVNGYRTSHNSRRRSCWMTVTGWACWCWMKIAASAPMPSR